MGLKQLTDYVGWSSIEYASTYVRDNKNLPFAISKTNKSKNKETGKGINPLPALLINNNNR
jgi:O-glycosyl hydrolase